MADALALSLPAQPWREWDSQRVAVIARLRARYDDIEGLGSARTAPRTWLAQCGWRLRTPGGALKLQELPRFL